MRGRPGARGGGRDHRGGSWLGAEPSLLEVLRPALRINLLNLASSSARWLQNEKSTKASKFKRKRSTSPFSSLVRYSCRPSPPPPSLPQSPSSNNYLRPQSIFGLLPSACSAPPVPL